MRAELRAKRDALLPKIKSRPAIMGVLKAMTADGCDIVDIGGESTRPAAVAVPEVEELARVEPVLTQLVELLDVPLSIDTCKAVVAARAAEVGVVMINDVWGLQRDARMADVVAQTETAVVIMHNRAERDGSVDIFADMRRFFDRSLALAARAGIRSEMIILDPGIGFGKTSRQNLEALSRIPDLTGYGFPVLVGASRKAFLGSLTGDGIEATLIGTVAVSLLAAAAGASIFRVHDVAAHVAALRVYHAIRANGGC